MTRRILTAVTAGLAFLGVALAPGVASARVSSVPAATPQLGTSGTDGTIEQIRQIVQCGPTMYAVGKFSAVKNGGASALITRNNAFAFSATSPYKVTAWDPNVNGQVDTVACDARGAGLLLGGVFTTVHGVAAKNIARVDLTTGAVDTRFTLKSIPGRVAHIEVVGGHALVGGYFPATTSPAAAAGPAYLRSYNPATGVKDGYGLPAISGTYSYTGVVANPTRIWNMTPAPGGSAVLMTGVFTSVGGQRHEQVFRLNMTAGAATVSPWSPTELYTHCYTKEPFYAQDAAWSPDLSAIYVATTGYKPDGTGTSGPRTGPCDAAIAFPATQGPVAHKWINYTGCDSYFSVAADVETVFTGGHQRWVSNTNGCDVARTPAHAQPGLAEFDPATGDYQPGPNRGRGLGADDLLRTAAGLWIASDNQANTNDCAGQYGHMGLCFLPNG
jgi:hypothetical protein